MYFIVSTQDSGNFRFRDFTEKNYNKNAKITGFKISQKPCFRWTISPKV